MNANDLNDDLSDLLGNAGAPRPAQQPPANYKPVDFTEPCPKCRGTGRFVSYSGRVLGPCFTCKGAGKQTFKTSAADRAKARAQREERTETKAAGNLVAFKAEHPAAHAWLEAQAPGFAFAASLLEAVAKYGYLTENQMAAVERGIAKDATRKAEAQARVEQAPVVDTAGIDRLKEAFDKAAAYTAAKARGLTVRNPKITIGGMTISPAKATSKNPGALYVKASGEYLGKIADGKFFAVAACTPEQQKQVLSFVADPAEAAKVYGQETGVCCVCNATLRSEWRLRGIGPICAEKFGW